MLELYDDKELIETQGGVNPALVNKTRKTDDEYRNISNDT